MDRKNSQRNTCQNQRRNSQRFRALILALILSFPISTLAAETVDRIVAKVSDEVITQNDLNEAIREKTALLN